MMKRRRLAGVVAAVMVVAAATIGLPASASAFSGEYAEFNNCPVSNPSVVKCQFATTTGGEVVLGTKAVPIVNPVVLQGGYGFPTKGLASFFEPTSGPTLSKAAQPVPGGLAGIVNCKEISNFIVRAACEFVFENGLTGLNSTLELAGPASEIKVGEAHLLFERETALRMPVKFHLENPLLGSSCYVGSSTSPIIWNLTTGATAPPAPNTSIHGSVGTIEFRGPDEGILRLNGAKLVDNAWSAPGATGCGGAIAELILDPIINSASGLPAAAGKNTASLINVIDSSPAEVVIEHP
jgi:hypothetical protein